MLKANECSWWLCKVLRSETWRLGPFPMMKIRSEILSCFNRSHFLKFALHHRGVGRIFSTDKPKSISCERIKLVWAREQIFMWSKENLGIQQGFKTFLPNTFFPWSSLLLSNNAMISYSESSWFNSRSKSEPQPNTIILFFVMLCGLRFIVRNIHFSLLWDHRLQLTKAYGSSQ